MVNRNTQLIANLKPIGAWLDNGVAHFAVWAPLRNRVDLHIISPIDRTVPLERTGGGYWRGAFDDIGEGWRYFFRLDDDVERPDPASRCQPDGVHGASELIDHARFAWRSEGWSGPELREMIMYELHVGTFTPEGTFDGVVSRLDDLAELGINAVEIMPVAAFPGNRNWGYDGVYPFAVQDSYGGPEGLKRLVDAAHGRDLAVILDVVYNHLGPEGNYLSEYGPYFTDRYRTPWGQAINFDGAHSDAVRNYFIANALAWLRDYRIDALRLDAVHGIFDQSATPFLQELAEHVEAYSRETGRRHWLIAESDLNDGRLIRPRSQGGCGLSAQWSDDFHHCLHTLLTGENSGYYADFGRLEQMAKALREGFVYSGEYSPFRQRRHGSSSTDLPAEQLVVCSQNHDQTGNRMNGDRLSTLVSFDALKLAAGVVLLSPYIPLLWMGEEYGEVAPFLYFVSHSDPDLIEAVRKGRRAEFAAFGWAEDAPDPQSVSTFERSRLDWSKRSSGNGAVLLRFYRRLIELRTSIKAFGVPTKDNMNVDCDDTSRSIICRREYAGDGAVCIMCFSDQPSKLAVDLGEGSFLRVLDSADEEWAGSGSHAAERMTGSASLSLSPWHFVVYHREHNS